MKNSNGNVIKTCTTNDAFLSSSTLEGGSRVRVFKETSQTRPPSARTLRNILGKRGEEKERKREKERKGTSEEASIRRHKARDAYSWEACFELVCIVSQRPSHDFFYSARRASYLGYSRLPRLRDELKRNLRACSCLTYVELFACANWFILVQTPFSLSLCLVDVQFHFGRAG